MDVAVAVYGGVDLAVCFGASEWVAWVHDLPLLDLLEQGGEYACEAVSERRVRARRRDSETQSRHVVGSARASPSLRLIAQRLPCISMPLRYLQSTIPRSYGSYVVLPPSTLLPLCLKQNRKGSRYPDIRRR